MSSVYNCESVMRYSCCSYIRFCAFCGLFQLLPRRNESHFTRLQELLWVTGTCAWRRWQQGHLEEKGLMLCIYTYVRVCLIVKVPALA